MAGTYDVQVRSVPADRATDAVPLSQVVLQHHRTDGIQIEAQPLSGGHLLHLAVAGCVFNDLYHLAAERGIRLTDVRVAATGGFEGEEPTISTGITYQVSVSGEASEEQLRELVAEVDRTASIPDVLRRETAVSLSDLKVAATR
jgi:putative redox protein